VTGGPEAVVVGGDAGHEPECTSYDECPAPWWVPTPSSTEPEEEQ
jgi:hypothetical protein